MTNKGQALAGQNRARVSLLVLFGTYATAVLATPTAPANSMEGVVLDAVSFSILFLVPVVFLAIRVREDMKDPNKPLEGTR